VAPLIPSLRAEVEALLQASGMTGRVKLLDGQSHAALAACDATLIASGTATLEAALFKRPMVIAYNMNALSWRLMQRKQLQPWVGLPNILCRDFVVPELLQEAASPEALAQATLAWLDAPGNAGPATKIFRAACAIAARYADTLRRCDPESS
jgi:lipid-A-disaccharide synthase